MYMISDLQGWVVGQMGPSFPDLRQIVKQDLNTSAWLFTIFSIGYLIGSFILGNNREIHITG